MIGTTKKRQITKGEKILDFYIITATTPTGARTCKLFVNKAIKIIIKSLFFCIFPCFLFWPFGLVPFKGIVNSDCVRERPFLVWKIETNKQQQPRGGQMASNSKVMVNETKSRWPLAYIVHTVCN